MPLNLAQQGKEVKVLKVFADDKTKRHLENLGILSGAEIVPLSESNGNIIIKVHDSRLAINAQLAMKIFVA